MKDLIIFLNTFQYKNKLKVKNFKFKKTKFLVYILKSLELSGFVSFFFYHQYLKQTKVFLSYSNNSKRTFSSIIPFSRNFNKVFLSSSDIVWLKKNFSTGFFFISTSKGILVDTSCIKNGIGGFLLFWVF